MDNCGKVISELRQELEDVDRHLLAAVTDLTSPLGGLIQSQIRLSTPPMRAAFVLASGTDGSKGHDQRRQRIFLAAGLEMLHVALRVHKLLVVNVGTATPRDTNGHCDSEAEQVDRSVIGSTILAGDYCFSRAAQLVAQTDNPRVVDIFAHTLQIVSEDQLRVLFTDEKSVQEFDPLPQLLHSGVRAASKLTNLSLTQRQAVLEFAREAIGVVVDITVDPAVTNGDLARLDVSTLPPMVQDRWTALLSWLIANQIGVTPQVARPSVQ